MYLCGKCSCPDVAEEQEEGTLSKRKVFDDEGGLFPSAFDFLLIIKALHQDASSPDCFLLPPSLCPLQEDTLSNLVDLLG